MNLHMACDQCYVEENKGWFTSILCNELYEVDFEKQKIKFLDFLPDSCSQFRAYAQCVKYEDSIYLFPDTAKDIYRFDLLEKQWECFEQHIFDSVRASNVVICVRDERVYLFSRMLANVMVFGLNEKKFIHSFSIGKEEDEIVGRAIYSGDKLYVTIQNKPCIYIIDPFDDIVEKRTILCDAHGFIQACSVEDELWVSGKEKKIYRVYQDDSVKEYVLNKEYGDFMTDLRGPNPQKEFEPEDNVFFGSRYYKNKLWMIPYVTNKICYIDLNNDQIVQVPDDNMCDQYYQWRGPGSTYVDLCVLEDRYLILFCVYSNRFLCVDMENATIKVMNMKLDGTSLNFNEFIRSEDEKYELNDYIRDICEIDNSNFGGLTDAY